MHHVSDFGHNQGMAPYMADGYGAFCQLKFECGCCKTLVFEVCGLREYVYLFCLFGNPDLDGRIFNCLKTSMGEVLRPYFLCMGDLNSLHQEWLHNSIILRP